MKEIKKIQQLRIIKRIFILLFILFSFSGCNVDMKKLEAKAELMNRYELVALKLARENRELHAEVKRLEFNIEKLKQEKTFLEKKVRVENVNQHEDKVGELANNKHGESSRSIASISSHSLDTAGKKDFVEFKIYKWHADDLLKIADKEFKEKNFEKAAQFYTSVTNYYPENKSITDDFYFKAGIASFETGAHHDWAIKHFESLMTKYPTSQYFRSAKLWIALTNMKLGNKKKFYETVEEFRKKYRNTKEWKILSSYYEKIEEKTNE